MPLVISASYGIRGAGKKDFVSGLRGALEARYPGFFEFVPSPLAELTHPITRVREIQENPVGEHQKNWDLLNNCTGQVSLALAAGKIVVVEDFGIDLHTPIVAVCDDRIHPMLRENQDKNVKQRVIERGTPAPHYLLRGLPEDGSTSAFVSDIVRGFPDLHKMPRDLLRHFVLRQQEAISGYCNKIADQNPPIWLQGTTTEELVAYALGQIVSIAELPTPQAIAAD